MINGVANDKCEWFEVEGGILKNFVSLISQSGWRGLGYASSIGNDNDIE